MRTKRSTNKTQVIQYVERVFGSSRGHSNVGVQQQQDFHFSVADGLWNTDLEHLLSWHPINLTYLCPLFLVFKRLKKK